MSHAATRALRTALHRLLLEQGLLIAGAALVVLATFDVRHATALLYGGAMAMVNTLLQLWCLRRAERKAGNDAGRNLRVAYSCALQRLVVTAALFTVAFAALKLEPLPLLGGFVLCQVVVVVDGFRESILRRRHG